MVMAIAAKPAGEERDAMTMALASYMRKQYLIWNKDTVSDQTIFNDIRTLSNGTLTVPEGAKLSEIQGEFRQPNAPGIRSQRRDNGIRTKRRKGRHPMASDKKQRIRDNFRLIAGWLFLAVGLYLLVAFVSYLFTWTVDQSLLSEGGMSDPQAEAANSAGLIGNYWSNLFIGELFGISAFIIPFFLAALAIFLLRIKKVRIIPLFFITAFICIILSVSLGYIFSFTSLEYVFGAGVGGTYGYRVNEWLISMLGTVGTGVVLFFVLTAFLVPFVYRWVRKRKIKAGATEETEPVVVPETSIHEPESITEREIKTTEPVRQRESKENESPEQPVFEVEKIEEESTAGDMFFYDPKQDLSRYRNPL
jgi:S-DNA-T family DNA segregation ATPase FtsK/SpoIIIE